VRNGAGDSPKGAPLLPGTGAGGVKNDAAAEGMTSGSIPTAIVAEASPHFVEPPLDTAKAAIVSPDHDDSIKGVDIMKKTQEAPKTFQSNDRQQALISLVQAASTTGATCLAPNELQEIDHGPHIVPPPEGTVTLVCCQTTKGPLSIAVHPTWAPIGAKNFLQMVTSGFFSSKVGLFRALKGFLVQFGLAGVPKVQTDFERDYIGGRGGLKDDPPWLPLGPPGTFVYRIRANFALS
jgi:Cyclophilin type peptidyl-prolyl cis-trans isomerase/CLD